MLLNHDKIVNSVLELSGSYAYPGFHRMRGVDITAPTLRDTCPLQSYFPSRPQVHTKKINEPLCLSGESWLIINPDSISALFLIRDDEFTETLPNEIKDAFVDGNALCTEKMKKLKEMLKEHFPVSLLLNKGRNTCNLNLSSRVEGNLKSDLNNFERLECFDHF